MDNQITFGTRTANAIAKAAREQEYEDWLSQPADNGNFSLAQSEILLGREDLQNAINERNYWQEQIHNRQRELNQHRAAYLESKEDN